MQSLMFIKLNSYAFLLPWLIKRIQIFAQLDIFSENVIPESLRDEVETLKIKKWIKKLKEQKLS